MIQDKIPEWTKEPSKENNQEPQQAQHMTSFTREKTKFDSQSIYLIRKPVGILARHSNLEPESCVGLSKALHDSNGEFACAVQASRDVMPASRTGSRSGNSATIDRVPPIASMERRSVDICMSVRFSISDTRPLLPARA